MVNKGGAAPDASWLLSLYSQMSRGVVFQDGSGAILSANPAAENILGLSLEQMAGRSSLDPRWNAVRRTGEPFEGSRHPAMVALATGQPVFDEIMGVRKPGRGDYTWIQINAFPLKEGGGIVGVFTTFEDVTERLRAEEELRASELRYRSLFENMLLGVAVHELVYDEGGEAVDYVFLDANQAFGKLTGLDPAAIVGKRVTEVIPDIEPGYIANYGEVARTGKSIVFESEAAALGRRYLISAFKTGERRFATIFDDITERAAAAAALGRAAEERRALFRELEHRVKNSLALIAGLITLEEDRAPDATSRKALQETRDRITSLAALYEQLHAGGDSLDVAAGEYLSRVVEGIASSYAPEGKGIVVGAEVEPIVLPASAAASLGIVVNELVTNALKHGFPGGRRGRVDVRLARRGGATRPSSASRTTASACRRASPSRRPRASAPGSSGSSRSSSGEGPMRAAGPAGAARPSASPSRSRPGRGFPRLPGRGVPGRRGQDLGAAPPESTWAFSFRYSVLSLAVRALSRARRCARSRARKIP